MTADLPDITAEQLRALPRRERRAIVKKTRARIKYLRHEIRRNQSEADVWERVLAIYEACRDQLKHIEDFGVRFTKPPSASLHQLRQALADGECINLYNRDKPVAKEGEFRDYLNEAELFVIEHDWASAFDNAVGMEGSFRLPYDTCCFEFCISGYKALVLASNYNEVTDTENLVVVQVCYGTPGGWVIDAARFHKDGSEDADDPNAMLHRKIVAQIKAVSIALDADVAVHSPVRADENFSKARVKAGKVAPKNYHVVALAKQSRVEGLPTGQPAATRRLHFRRGHWRHLPTFKTWVRWCLVGDPDLGFVDKHYRF